MAVSTCIKCSGIHFEAKEHSPKHANFKVIFIQCSGCGGVAGVMDYYHVPAFLAKIAKKMGFDIYK